MKLFNKKDLKDSIKLIGSSLDDSEFWLSFMPIGFDE